MKEARKKFPNDHIVYAVVDHEHCWRKRGDKEKIRHIQVEERRERPVETIKRHPEIKAAAAIPMVDPSPHAEPPDALAWVWQPTRRTNWANAIVAPPLIEPKPPEPERDLETIYSTFDGEPPDIWPVSDASDFDRPQMRVYPAVSQPPSFAMALGYISIALVAGSTATFLFASISRFIMSFGFRGSEF